MGGEKRLFKKTVSNGSKYTSMTISHSHKHPFSLMSLKMSDPYGPIIYFFQPTVCWLTLICLLPNLIFHVSSCWFLFVLTYLEWVAMVVE